MAQRFTTEEITPNAAAWDEQHIFPREVFAKGAALGFGGIYLGEQHGGCNLGREEAAIIIEALAYGCPSTAAFFSIHNMAAWIIDAFANDDLRSEYLPELASMARVASYCLTEPGAGSDAASLKTKAERRGNDYLISGSKAFISGAGASEVYVLMARTGGSGASGVSCFLIDKEAKGISFGANERKLGWHSQPTAMINLDQVRVPASARIGGEGDGFKIAMAALDGGRINIGACSLGGAQRCLDEALAYVKDRRQFNKRIADFQNTQFQLADMRTRLEAARQLLYVAAQKVSANESDKTEFAAMAKLLSTETGSEVVDQALQLHGGYGFLMDYPIERFYRDLRVHQILEGTSEIMRYVIGREMIS